MNGTPGSLTAVVVACAALAASGVVLAPPASATDHATSLVVSCVDGQARLVIDLAGFPGGLDNRITATDNATVLVDQTFRGDYRHVWNLPGPTQHSFSVFVTSADDLDQTRGYTTHQEKHLESCPAAAPPTKAGPAAAPPAAGRPPAPSAPAAAPTEPSPAKPAPPARTTPPANTAPPAEPAPPHPAPQPAAASPAATPAQGVAPAPGTASISPAGPPPAHPASTLSARPGPSIGKPAAPSSGPAAGAASVEPPGTPSPSAVPDGYPDPYGDRTLPGPRSGTGSLLASETPAQVGVDASAVAVLATIIVALLLAWLAPRLLRRVAATSWWQERRLRPSRTVLRS